MTMTLPFLSLLFAITEQVVDYQYHLARVLTKIDFSLKFSNNTLL
jgi:hypothetical protein